MPEASKINPLVAIAAVSVTVFSLAGIATKQDAPFGAFFIAVSGLLFQQTCRRNDIGFIYLLKG